MTIRTRVARTATRLAGAGLLALTTAGCAGGADTEARGAVERLVDALVEPDAGALRALVESDSDARSTDLLTDEIVADNALAGRQVEIDADIDRFNGYGTFTVTSPEERAVELSVDLRLTATSTTGALPGVALRIDPGYSTLLVNGHRVRLRAGTADETPSGGPTSYYLPPGTWTLDLPASPYARTTPQRVDLRARASSTAVQLEPTITAAGRVEAISRAEAYVRDCGRRTTNPRSGCGGPLTLCVGKDTARTVTFEPEPVWRTGARRDTTLSHQPGLERTVTTTCTDRDSGAVSETSRTTDDVTMTGTIALTDTGLDVDLG